MTASDPNDRRTLQQLAAAVTDHHDHCSRLRDSHSQYFAAGAGCSNTGTSMNNAPKQPTM
jgi:hypothetical protein